MKKIKSLLGLIIFLITPSLLFAVEPLPSSQLSQAGQSLTASTFKGEGWIKISGDSAKLLYDRLQVEEQINLEGPGDGYFFKYGQDYNCYFNSVDVYYSCEIQIKNLDKGLLF